MHEKGKERTKERKERKARKKRKKSKKQPHSNWVSVPHHHYRIIEPNQPPDHPLHLHLHHLHSSKNPTIPMLNSNLAYQKKKSQQKATTNNQVCQSIQRDKKKLTLHRTTIMSTLQIRADFLLHNRFGSAETTCPTRTRFLHHFSQQKTQTH